VVIHSIISGVRPVVIRLLASCVSVNPQSWMFALSALCFIFYLVLVRLYQGSFQTLFSLNVNFARQKKVSASRSRLIILGNSVRADE
jgi:hypothetical protein